MDAHLTGMLTSLREGQRAIDAEVQPLLQSSKPDWWMLQRVHDAADEYAGRARVVRRMMSKAGAAVADPDEFEEVDRLCEYFDSTAALTAQQTGDREADPSAT